MSRHRSRHVEFGIARLGAERAAYARGHPILPATARQTQSLPPGPGGEQVPGGRSPPIAGGGLWFGHQPPALPLPIELKTKKEKTRKDKRRQDPYVLPRDRAVLET
jgi:hypothetical protein